MLTHSIEKLSVTPPYHNPNPSNNQSVIIVDPTQLTIEQKKLLHQVLSIDEASKQPIKIFKHNKIYHYIHIRFQLTYPLVRQTTHILEIGYKEYSYTIYDPTHLVGAGSFGKVYAVVGKLKHVYTDHTLTFKKTVIEKPKVIKVQIINHHTSPQLIKNENKIGQLAKHTHTKKVTFKKNKFGVKKTAYMVMNTLPGVTFDQIIHEEYFSIATRLLITIRLIEALDEQVHLHHIIHRDIKPKNILVDINKIEVNIFDFGLSTLTEDRIACGTLFWAAPETVSGKALTTQQSDYYSLGRVMREWWGDNIIKQEKYLASKTILLKRQYEYHHTQLPAPTTLTAAIKKELAYFLQVHPTSIIKTYQQFTQVLDSLTSPTPEERQPKIALKLFEDLYYSALYNRSQKKIAMLALRLKRKLYRLSEEATSIDAKLKKITKLISKALGRLGDDVDTISFFINMLGIQALNHCRNKAEIIYTTQSIVNKMKKNLKKRACLRENLIQANGQRQSPFFNQQMSLYKKEPIILLDKMKLFNQHYHIYHLTKKPSLTLFNELRFNHLHDPVKAATSIGLVGGALGVTISFILAACIVAPPAGFGILLILLPLIGLMLGGLVGLLTAAQSQKNIAKHGLFKPSNHHASANSLNATSSMPLLNVCVM